MTLYLKTYQKEGSPVCSWIQNFNETLFLKKWPQGLLQTNY